MPDPALTAEPHFWTKEVILPIGLTLGTSLMVFYARQAFQVAKTGYRRASLKRAQTQLKFARRLREDPTSAQIYMTFQAVSAAFPVAACAIGAGLMVIGYVGSKSFAEAPAIICGSVLIGMSAALLATHFSEALFVLRATMLFEALEQSLQRRIARLEK